MKKIFLVFAFCFLPFTAFATNLFDDDIPIVDNIQVFESSDFFAEVFQKFSDAKFAGKDIRTALESLETLSPKVKIATTDHRIVIVREDEIIGNWPRPQDGDWKSFGQIATAILLKMRIADQGLAAQSQGVLYSTAVVAMTDSLDANGRYIPVAIDDGKLLTGTGLEGRRDDKGNWRITGVVKGSQADMSGINDGDLILEINGDEVAKLSDVELSAAFAGFNSGTVKLKVSSPKETKKIVLRRASLVMADTDIVWRQDSADKKQELKILEIIVYNVSENSVAIVNEALNKYKDASGIILDLRTARGGDERAAAKLAGLFLGAVPVMRIDDGTDEELEVIPGGDAVTNAPVVVLLSGQTQGAAEAIALAFNENARGALVGTPTSANARLSTKIKLSNGGMIELGNRRIKSGNGTIIDERGVFPIICLSNIRNTSQKDVFFVNVINGDFSAKDYNADEKADPNIVRKGCPNIKSGVDEDAIALAVSTKILTDNAVYEKLVKDVSE